MKKVTRCIDHPPSFFTRPGSSIHSRSEGSLMEYACRWIGDKLTNRRRGQEISTDVLPDDVLLGIFDFYVVAHDTARVGLSGLCQLPPGEKKTVEALWQTLVHVCRQWRRIVFGSPRRLNLRLICISGTPARDTLDVWPALPLLISASVGVDESDQRGVDNIVAALGRSDCVDEIRLSIYNDSAMEKVWAAIQEPFPELTSLDLELWSHSEVLWDSSFLGGSAQRLRKLRLHSIPFPGLPKILLFATHLVDLYLWNIPHSGYIPPEAMATALSTLTCLKTLYLRFQSPQSRPDRESPRPLPPIRSVLPVLTSLNFKGDNGYIDDLVARIDAPRLNDLNITFFNQIVFDTPQFIQFISRSPTLKEPEKAHVAFEGDTASVRLTSGSGWLRVEVRCIDLDWQVSSVEQVCTSSLPPLSTLKDLYIVASPPLAPSFHFRRPIHRGFPSAIR